MAVQGDHAMVEIRDGRNPPALASTASPAAEFAEGLHQRRLPESNELADSLSEPQTAVAIPADSDDKPASSKDISVDIPTPPSPIGPNGTLLESSQSSALAEDDEMGHKAPKLGLLPLFWLFLKFGMRAWGGPVAQIAMIKEDLVIKAKWISIKKFNRVCGYRNEIVNELGRPSRQRCRLPNPSGP